MSVAAVPAPAAPLHVQIARLLIREIMAGRLADGQRLPPEREMAAEMGIAVGTLRKALADLAAQGLLERVQGSGNYVRAGADISGLYSFFRLERPEGGGVPGAEVLSVARMAVPADLPGLRGTAHRIRRLRYLDDAPVALEEIWLDGARAERLEAADLAPSLYRHYRAALGFWIAAAEDRVGVAPAPDWAAPPFAPAPGAPCTFVTRIGRAQDGRIAETSRTWADPARAVYVQRMT